ncbi:MAG: type II toxin-antitoxin system VapC family toxin [Mycobacteriaceae bacterium]
MGAGQYDTIGAIMAPCPRSRSRTSRRGLTPFCADGGTTRARLRGEVIHAPELIYPEVASVVRKLVATGGTGQPRADLAVEELHDLPIRASSHLPLLPRVRELRDNVTPYDTQYIALAELLDCALVTTDARLSRAPGIRSVCEALGD